MDFEILKVKKLNDEKNWLLAELNLKDYVESLTEENFNFSIQRKIVKNKYLDTILKTIESDEPLPSITLAYHGKLNDVNISSIMSLEINKLDILDGLQRTYRLWAFWKIYNNIKENDYTSLKEAILSIKETYPDFFQNGIVDSKFFKTNFPDGKVQVDFSKKYEEYNVYFTIWTNLSESELVKKMLILNAGHKAVSTQHQFEILFLSLWRNLKENLNGIKIIREKDEKFTLVKRGDRSTGQYLFSTIITSLMSLILAKPQRISGDIIYKYDLIEDKDTNTLKFYEIIFNSTFIVQLLNKVKLIDDAIEINYDKNGVSWFGKDTTLNGVFAGVGRYLKLDKFEEAPDNLEGQILNAFDKVKDTLIDDLKLEEFNKNYDNLSGRSVNIGNLIRSVIMSYTIKRLEGEDASWSKIFSEEMSSK